MTSARVALLRAHACDRPRANGFRCACGVTGSDWFIHMAQVLDGAGVDAGNTSPYPEFYKVSPAREPVQGRNEPAMTKPVMSDTFPQWLAQRFGPYGALFIEDREYWEQEARAVRRAVARNGFRREAQAEARQENEPALRARVRAVLINDHETTCGVYDEDRIDPPCTCWQADLRAALSASEGSEGST